MNKQNRPNKIIYRIAGFCSLLGTLLIITVIVLCAGLVIPGIRGYQSYSVITGSMAPTIPAGSLIYVEHTVVEEIQESDVIAYYSSMEDGSVITHRVVKNDLVNGEFVTKGDANENKDPLAVPYEMVIGKVIFALPAVGNILMALTSAYGKIFAACMVVGGAILNFFGNYIRDKNSYK